MTPYQAVLFISFGGPEKSDDIMPFLEIVTRGRNIPRPRLVEVATHYEHLGGRSPINEITRRQAKALETELAAQGAPLPVFIGQRNWHPFIEETLREMKAKGIARAVGFITAAHRSEASLDRYVAAVDAAREAIGPGAPIIDYVDPWFDHPLFIEAIAARVREILDQAPSLKESPWHFIAHSIPSPMAEASTYVADLRQTMERVCAVLHKDGGTLAYSSRSGRPGDPWLEPDVNDVLKTDAARGATQALFVTIGFIADHVEVLFDQDVEARATAKAVGLTLYRSATVGDHPLFVRMMADVVRKRLHGPLPQEVAHG